MQSINVPAGWVAAGTLPPCCARHGKPATQWQKRSFYTKTPGWVFALLLIAVLIALIVSLVLRRTVEGRLPACDDCRADRRRFVWSVVGAWVFDIVAIGLLAHHGAAALLLWLLLTVGVLVFSFSADRFRVAGRVSKDLHWVELRGVHPSFASAISGALVPPQQFTPAPASAPLPPAPAPAPVPVPVVPAPAAVTPPVAPPMAPAPVEPPPATHDIGSYPPAPAAMTILPGR